jgi:hypothetical protein
VDCSDDTSFQQKVIAPHKAKANTSFQSDDHRASSKKRSLSSISNGPSRQAFGNISNIGRAAVVTPEPRSHDQEEEEPEDHLIEIYTADTAKLRRMGLYDLCVPLDEKRRPVILSIHKNHSSTVWQTMKNRLKLKRLSDPERSYETSVRFLGERQDRTYYCVEGFVSKICDSPFARFVNDKDLCREVFIEKSFPDLYPSPFG